MALPTEIVHTIDRARRTGKTPGDVAAELERAGVDPTAAIAEYMATPDHTGRPRAEANPGDPADPLAAPKR